MFSKMKVGPSPATIERRPARDRVCRLASTKIVLLSITDRKIHRMTKFTTDLKKRFCEGHKL